FMNQLGCLICDEGHCVSQWGGSFQLDYASLDQLRYLLPSYVQFCVVSATLPYIILDDIHIHLHLKPDMLVIWRSNDHCNCWLVVQKMQHTISLKI
ncbi:hypothetical protein K439DRAFT_1364734, partial [Ramaria rubella]